MQYACLRSFVRVQDASAMHEGASRSAPFIITPSVGVFGPGAALPSTRAIGIAAGGRRMLPSRRRNHSRLRWPRWPRRPSLGRRLPQLGAQASSWRWLPLAQRSPVVVAASGGACCLGVPVRGFRSGLALCCSKRLRRIVRRRVLLRNCARRTAGVDPPAGACELRLQGRGIWLGKSFAPCAD